jgi:hypothetical protein
LRLIVITVIPRHPTSPTSIVEHDISIGEAGDVSIGDLHPNRRINFIMEQSQDGMYDIQAIAPTESGQ